MLPKLLTAIYLAAACTAVSYSAVARAEPSLPAEAREFLTTYCVKCHGGEKTEEKLDLAKLAAEPKLATDAKRWLKVIERVHAGEMPPENAKAASAEEREKFAMALRQLVQNAICAQGPQPGPAPIRRLNRTEYSATMRDLLGIQATVGQLLPDDGAGGEGFDNAAETLFLSPLHAEKFLEAARAALDYGSKDPRSRSNFLSTRQRGEGGGGRGRRGGLPAPPEPPLTEEQAKTLLERFLPRAFRRPTREGELGQYLALFTAATERGESAEQALLFAMQGVLMSPHFLFRLEEPNRTAERQPVGQYEIASRLSYFLWASMPDEDLLGVAAEGKLNEPEALRAQVARMLKSTKTREFTESFIEQWLGTRELGRNVKPDRTANRSYTNELEWALKQEPVLFFQYVLAENRPVLELIDSNYTFLDSKLQRHYRLEIKGTNQQLKRFDLPEGSHRGGLLGMGGVLAVSSLPHRTSPVVRGKWVKETLLGTPPPPPPPDVPQLDEKATALAQSLRQRLELHRQNAVCASCHNSIDPIGFGLENYDLLGRWRTEDGGQTIDATGELPDGSKFDGPEGLKQSLLAKKDDFVRQLTRKLLGFGLGRGLTIEDQCTVEEIVTKVREGEYRSHVLIAEIVCSVPFRYRAPQ